MTTESTPEIVPGSPEYNAAMIARADKAADPKTFEQTPETPAVSAIPEGGHEKFYDAQSGQYNWQAHAKELEWKLAQKKPGEAQAEPKAGEGEAQEVPQDAAASDLITKLGFKEGELGEAIATTGDIPAEARAKFVAAGIPDEIISEFVENAQYRINAEKEKMLAPVGGEAGWKELNEWAVANLTDAEKAQVNAMLGDPRLISHGLDWLKSRRAAANPLAAEGQLVSGYQTAGTGSVGFGSRAEQSRAINDPRYRTDPAYRQQVQQRMMVSRFTNEHGF